MPGILKRKKKMTMKMTNLVRICTNLSKLLVLRSFCILISKRGAEVKL